MEIITKALVSAPAGFPADPEVPASVQPGGGACMCIELAWGRLRRFSLRLLRPGYVRHMQAKRQGECPHCPHDIIDSRDLKYFRNVCGYWFKPEDDRFAWRDRLRMARYGLAELLLFSLLLFAVAFIAGCLAVWVHWSFCLLEVPIGLAWLEIVWFFRDPERTIPVRSHALVSPADGTVTNVEEVDEVDFPGGRAWRVSIFLSIFNVHVNRLPCSAECCRSVTFQGLFSTPAIRRARSAMNSSGLTSRKRPAAGSGSSKSPGPLHGELSAGSSKEMNSIEATASA